MDLAKYQRLAMRTSTKTHDRVLNGCLGLIGESGEIVDAVKKWRFQSGDHPPIPTEKLKDECGDVLWYCAELATGLKLDLADCYDEARCNQLANQDTTLTDAAVYLSQICQVPYQDHKKGILEKNFQQINLTRIVAGVWFIAKDYAECTLKDVMQYNIDKLKRRYPNGFEAERSLNREE